MNRTYTTLGIISLVLIILGGLYYYRVQVIDRGAIHTYELPPLPYAFDALEPYIDTRTMEIHYTKHHQAYVTKLNEALKEYPEIRRKTVAQLLETLNEVPQALRTAVRNNGGGHYNHSFFWRVMSPKGTREPVGALKSLIDKQFGSFTSFKEQFTKAANQVFGSGWAWLCVDSSGTLKIMTTANQDCPLSQGFIPLLCLDVWEHAYYLHYQNNRAGYSDAWWNVVNWDQVEKNYQKARDKKASLNVHKSQEDEETF